MMQNYQSSTKQTTAVQQSNCPPSAPLHSRYGCKVFYMLNSEDFLTAKFDIHKTGAHSYHITMNYVWHSLQQRNVLNEMEPEQYAKVWASCLSTGIQSLNETREGK